MVENIYINYINYLSSIKDNNIVNINFKCNSKYTLILEHVSYEIGQKYLNLIKSEYNVLDADIIKYTNKNDLIGNPKKYKYKLIDTNQDIFCSPSSLRYIYQAHTILYKYRLTNCSKIVEIGGGYGGLLLAIEFFSKKMEVNIEHYYIIDINEVNNLINKYINYHNISINYSTHDAFLYGKDIEDNNLFLISNYCFTEINEKYRIEYINNLFDKISHGFITWQTGLIKLDYDIKFDKNYIEETPQTSSAYKNYYVWF